MTDQSGQLDLFAVQVIDVVDPKAFRFEPRSRAPARVHSPLRSFNPQLNTQPSLRSIRCVPQSSPSQSAKYALTSYPKPSHSTENAGTVSKIRRTCVEPHAYVDPCTGWLGGETTDSGWHINSLNLLKAH